MHGVPLPLISICSLTLFARNFFRSIFIHTNIYLTIFLWMDVDDTQYFNLQPSEQSELLCTRVRQ